ncbi:hypothetical protein OQA88_6530 [Cercophora sp. LCS_1]
MTNHVRGPSLIQARNNHNHHRFHSHQVVRSPQDSDSDQNHIRSPLQNPHDKRQVVVVQTVSVLHIIDEQGAVIGYSTLNPEPATQPVEPVAAATADLPALENLLPSPSLPGDVLPPSTETPALSGPGLSSLLSALVDTETVTSAPSSESSAFPSLAPSFNSTRAPSFYGNNTVLFSNSTRSSSSRTKYSSSLLPSSLTSVFAVPTDAVGREDGNGGLDGTPAGLPPTPTAEPAPPSGSGLTPAAQSAVIGGVVGSVAGVAIIALVLMFLLKWKKGQQKGLLLLGDGESSIRGAGGFGRKPSGGPGGMTEQSVPFAVPSALASLTGQRRLEAGPGEVSTGEKGFQRISGKKLTSVLVSGGDGYSDPHMSVMSGTSDYRQSEAFLGGPLSRLQLGSPMRPESGVPIMRSGPNRTPQATDPFSDGPFGDAPRPLTPPLITSAAGRSLTSLHGSSSGSRGSPNTRFSEAM